MPNKQDQDTSLQLIMADDHVIVRTGLQMLLESKLGLADIIEAESCAELLAAIKQNQPTHLITDLSFRDGNALEILPAIINLVPGLKIMVYSMQPAEVYRYALLRLGIMVYLHKEASRKEVLETLHAFIYKDDYSTLANEGPAKSPNPFDRLSDREVQVLHYLIQGKTNGFIAEALNLHKTSISTFKSRIMEKTGMKQLKDLLALAELYAYNK